MADWDPFADPSDSVAPPSATAASAPRAEAGASDGAGADVWGEFGQQDDIFAALRVPDKEPRNWTGEEFSELLDKLFSISDSDTAALKAAMMPIVEACAENGALTHPLWRRGVPLMMDLVDEKRVAARRPSLFGLLVDHQMGFMSSAESGKMNEIIVEPPPQEPGGVAVFVYGWGGGTVGDLEDIAGLYRELFPTAVICRMACCRKGSFGLRVQCSIAIKAALKAWTEAPAGVSPKLLVHVFSNAGFFTHTEMLKSWQFLSDLQEPHPLLGQSLPPMERVLRGVIYDSSPDCNLALGPCLQSHVQAMAAFVHFIVASDHDDSQEGVKKANWEARRAVQVLIGDASPFKDHLAKKPEKFLTKMSCDDGNTVDRLEPAVNMLFIYSLDDTIISYQGVEKWIERVMARSSMKAMAHPRRLCFEKSRHCFHKVMHKEEYWKMVRQFSLALLGS